MRLLVVSNRLPITVNVTNDELSIKDSSGGLVSGMNSYIQSIKDSNIFSDYRWIGWPGKSIPEQLNKIFSQMTENMKLNPVNLTSDLISVDTTYGTR